MCHNNKTCPDHPVHRGGRQPHPGFAVGAGNTAVRALQSCTTTFTTVIEKRDKFRKLGAIAPTVPITPPFSLHHVVQRHRKRRIESDDLMLRAQIKKINVTLSVDNSRSSLSLNINETPCICNTCCWLTWTGRKYCLQQITCTVPVHDRPFNSQSQLHCITWLLQLLRYNAVHYLQSPT